MELTKCKLGELLTQRREKNDGSDLPICGVSKDGLIPPKQIDADTSIYNVFYRDDFIFNPARMELNSIAINDRYDRAICSSLYEVFFVHRTDLLLPHYLKLIVKQPWFTRYCEFLGQGSAREYCRFNNISEIEVEFPSIEEQQKVIDYYASIQNRIDIKKQINDNLEAQASAIYHSLFDECSEWVKGSVSDFGEVIGGATPSKDIDDYFCSDGIVWLTPKDLTSTGKKFIYKGETDITNAAYRSCSTKLMSKGSVLLTSRAPVGCVAIAMTELCTNQGFKSIVPSKKIGTAFVYYFLKENKQLLESHSSGTTFMEISGNVLKEIPVSIPPEELTQKFADLCEPIFRHQEQIEAEIDHLLELQRTMVSQISSR